MLTLSAIIKTWLESEKLNWVVLGNETAGYIGLGATKSKNRPHFIYNDNTKTVRSCCGCGTFIEIHAESPDFFDRLKEALITEQEALE